MSQAQKHYLFHVLRLQHNDEVLVFNEREGEFLAKIHQTELVIKEQRRVLKPLTPKALAFGLFRPANMSWMIEKATELEVTDFFPLICAHSQYKTIQQDRMERIIIEACEQSGRCEIPTLHPIETFADFIQNLPSPFVWYFGDMHTGKKIEHAPYGAIIGPEGGFSPEEHQVLLTYAQPFTLGQRILRAETACIGAMLQDLHISP